MSKKFSYPWIYDFYVIIKRSLFCRTFMTSVCPFHRFESIEMLILFLDFCLIRHILLFDLEPSHFSILSSLSVNVPSSYISA